jgi:hypothetical protein
MSIVAVPLVPGTIEPKVVPATVKAPGAVLIPQRLLTGYQRAHESVLTIDLVEQREPDLVVGVVVRGPVPELDLDHSLEPARRLGEPGGQDIRGVVMSVAGGIRELRLPAARRGRLPGRTSRQHGRCRKGRSRRHNELLCAPGDFASGRAFLGTRFHRLSSASTVFGAATPTQGCRPGAVANTAITPRTRSNARQAATSAAAGFD